MSSTRSPRRYLSAPLSGLLLLAVLAGCEAPGGRLEEIRSLHEQNRFEETLEPLEKLLRERPHDAELLYLYGVANARTGRMSLALWPLREAREDPDWAVRAGTALARAALAAGDYGTAIEAASRVLDLEADDRVALAVRAEARVRANRLDDALADADRWLALDPQAREAQIVRLQSLLGLERVEEAEALFDELEGEWHEFPEPLADRYCAARALFAKVAGQIDLAEQHFEECLQAFPTGPLVVEQAVEFFNESGRPDRATEVLRKALEEEPTWALMRERLAARLRSAGEAQQAEQLLLAGTELEDPGAALNAWGALAAHYFQLGEFAKAVTAWEQVLERTQEPSPEDRFGYAEALIRAGRHAEALEVARELPEAYAELVRGLSLLEQGRPEEALEHFTAGLRLWPNNADARYLAAIAAERSGDFDRAIEEYRQSLRSGPAEGDAGVRLARLYEAEGAYEPARQVLWRHLDAQPRDPEARLLALRIAAQMRRGDWLDAHLAALAWPAGQGGPVVAQAAQNVASIRGPAAAVALLRRAPGIELTDPADADALRELVVQLLAAGRADEARAQVEASLAAHPDTAVFHEIQALALERGGASGGEVAAAYARALELDPDHAPALAALGRLAVEQGDTEAARSYYERAAAADPDDAESRRRAGELAAAAGDPEEAERRLEALLVDQPYDGRAAASLAALVLARGGEPQRARSLARRAVRFRGGPQAYAVLVEADLQAGEATQSVELLRAEAERQPRDPSLRYQLGRALAAAGEPQAAREAFQQALANEVFPERAEAEAALAGLASGGGGPVPRGPAL